MGYPEGDRPHSDRLHPGLELCKFQTEADPLEVQQVESDRDRGPR